MCVRMEPKCDHCSITQAVIYCISDCAKLCLNCDFYIHSANPLSFKHTRSLNCEKCCSRPSVIRCHEERISYCQDCHWKTNTCSILGHHVESLKPYSGCPSPTEFVKMWPLIFEPSVSSLVSPLGGSLPLNDPYNAIGNPILTSELDWLIDSSYSKGPQYMSYTTNLHNQMNMLSKGSPDLKLEEGEDNICEEINLEKAPLDFDVGNDIIGGSPQEHIASPDCLFIDITNTSITASNFIEGSSPEKQECTSYPSGPVQININNGLPLPLPTSPVLLNQIHPTMSLSISNITGESSATDYQDCGMSSGFIMSETPWESNHDVSGPQARNQAKLRYQEKKLKRSFGKQIRYASRKARADTRKRVKGRFVKAGDTYDYDPSSPPTEELFYQKR